MSAVVRPAVNLLSCCLAGCLASAPDADVIPGPAPVAQAHTTGRVTASRPEHLDDARGSLWARVPSSRAPRAVWEPPPSAVRALLHPLSGATFDRERGQAMVDAIAALPPERRALGLTGLTPAQISGSDLCENPSVRATFEDGGVQHTLEVRVPATTWLEGGVAPAVATFSDTCEAALLEGAGDVAQAVGDGCTDADERSLFAPGTACRSCLQVDGDLQRCLTEDACADAAVARERVGGTWYDLYEARVLACAPDLVVDARLLADEGSATLAQVPLFAADWRALCFDLWDEAAGEPSIACTQLRVGSDRDTLGDFTAAVVSSFETAGGDEVPAVGRIAFFAGVEVDGMRFDASYQFVDVFGGISMADRSSAYSWGLPPGGAGAPTDPLTPSTPDLWPRLYLAAASLKSASHISGILVVGYSLNRCRDDAWSPPGPDGSSVCRETGPWIDGNGPLGQDGWIAFYGTEGDFYAFTHTTLVGTGLPDPSLPGGFIPRILGSTTLSDEGWEACAWPDTFVPDRMRALDTAPATRTEPYASFDAETWRFGREEEPDAVMALATEQIREFCFDVRE